jgi:iron complex transport system substrate-binding protein
MSYRRIACLGAEFVHTLYLLGAQDCIAGITGYAMHPPQARREKPKISGFSSANIERILAVAPDLALLFSDLQADIARALAAAGIEVHVFNHRSLDGIARMVQTLGALVDKSQAATVLARDLLARVGAARAQSRRLARRPRVLFEEWNEPLITGIRWVAELIEAAGGEDCFPELSVHPHARDRIVTPAAAAARAPDIVIGSWCGRRFMPDVVRARPGWQDVPAVRDGELHEIKSPDILVAGPAAVLYGLPQLQRIVANWAQRHTEKEAKD